MNAGNPRRLLLAACLWLTFSSIGAEEPAGPGYQPPPGSDEAELWYAMARVEKDLQESPARVRDETVNAYVRELTCALAAEVCPEIRVYLLRSPYFNAFMAPNGMMVLFTGLLVRVEDEAQLAFVLGHEIGHYVHRHSIRNWRRNKEVGNLLVGIQLIAGGAGNGAVALAGALGAGASLASFSRDQEREADAFGFERVLAMHYDPAAGAQLWSGVMEEEKVNPRGLLSAIFASHPATRERIAAMQKRVAALPEQQMLRHPERLHAALARLRAGWLGDELARRNHAQAEVLLKRLLAGHPARGETLYFQGELYRRRAAEGDLERALEAYLEARTMPPVPASIEREIGLTLRRLGRHDEAAEAFAAYLRDNPEAPDRAMVEHYLARGAGGGKQDG